MEDISPVLQALFRWMHVFAGIIWIGHLYFFNWVNGPLQTKLDGPTKKAVVPELMPRALYWFRWGAAWTWITGILLLGLIYYHGRQAFDSGDWSMGAGVMILVTFAAVFIYDALWSSSLANNLRAGVITSYVILAAIIVAYAKFANFGYRGMTIHAGVLLGSTMAFNVWFRIWPNQQKIIRAVKDGVAPDAALVKVAGLRSRHNTYMSVPLVWTMLTQHTTFLSGGSFGIPAGYSFLVLLVVIPVAWHLVFQCYKKSGKVQGF
jgi:uncharacterized membrane protein